MLRRVFCVSPAISAGPHQQLLPRLTRLKFARWQPKPFKPTTSWCYHSRRTLHHRRAVVPAATRRMGVDAVEVSYSDLTITRPGTDTFKKDQLWDTIASVFDDITDDAFVSAEYDNGVVYGLRGGSEPTHCWDVAFAKLKARRFVASARCKLWWMTPAWGHNAAELPPETQFLLLEVAEGGPYAIALPLIDANRFRATIRPPSSQHGKADSDAMWIRVESGCDKVKGSKWEHALYVGAGWDPYELVEKGVATAARLSGGAKPFKEKQLPDSIDYFGWCTWDAFYSSVSAKGIAEGLSSLAAGNVPPKLLIIDDGWQLTDVDKEYRKPPSAKILKDMPQAAVDDTVNEYYKAEKELLGPVVRNVRSSSSAGSVLEELRNVDHVQDAATHQQQKGPAKPAVRVEPTTAMEKREEQRIFIVRLGVAFLQRVLGVIMGILEGLVLLLYQYIVDPAPPGSLPVRFFTWVTNGPGRGGMLEFFAETGNFTRRLLSVEANGKFSSPDAGPDAFFTATAALGSVVDHLRHAFGIDYVYVWHGLPAYWSGVALPEEPGVAKYNAQIMFAKPTESLKEVEPSMAWNPAVIAGIGVVDDPRELYEDMYRYLSNAGITGVKVDCQAGVGLIGSVQDGGPHMGLKFHSALEDAVLKYFPGNHAINCMCHSTENIYRFLHTAVARASDDFYPQDEPSFLPHLVSCTYNGLFMSALVLPDWDMFHSKHKAAQIHATARAVSGGPLYVSDKPNNHDFDILRQLVLPDGSILRAQLAGRPTRDCMFTDVMCDNKTLLKVWNANRCNAIVALFNVQGSSWDRRKRRFHIHKRKVPPLTTTVKVADVPLFNAGLPQAHENGRTADATGDQAELFVMYSSTTKDVALLGRDDAFPVQLSGGESMMVTIAPVVSKRGVNFAAIGLSNMLNGGGAVLSSSCVSTNQSGASSTRAANGALLGLKWNIKAKGCGRFLMYSSHRPAQVAVDGDSADFVYDTQVQSLAVELSADGDLRHDICVQY